MPVNAERRRELFRLVPEGALVTRTWLRDQGIGSHAIDNLLKSRQLATVKGGVYKREGSRPEWGDVIRFLQQDIKSDLTIGGLTALELQKLSHYLPMASKRSIHLYGTDSLPDWINTVVDNVSFVRYNIGSLLGQDLTEDSLLELQQFTRQVAWKDAEEGLHISSPERAILEVLDGVPDRITFEHADELMQGLSTLSPRVLQQILELFGNIMVRRLFLWFSDRHNHPWLKRIDREKIDLGSGNRVIARGGRLDKNYRITVPDFYE